MTKDLTLAAAAACKRLKFRFPYEISNWIFSMGMMVENYHKHTSWSNIIQTDSATGLIEFMRKSAEYGCTCCFSGEHGYQGQWLYVYHLCRESQDKEFLKRNQLSSPLRFRYSTEAYWVKDRTAKDRMNCHIVIVARNYHAIRKLNYILTLAHGEGFYGKPRIDLELLFMLSPEDVYVTSACIAGWKYEDAAEMWYQIWQHFKDSFFLEYQAHNTEEQQKLNEKIYCMAKQYGMQTIVGMDTHYIDEEDRVKRENLLLRKKLSGNSQKGWFMDFPDGKTVYRRMKEQGVLPEEEILYAMMNTHVFTAGCEEISISTDFKIPVLSQYKNYAYQQRSEILLNIMSKKYYEEERHRSKERWEGLLYEYGEIVESRTADYFLDNYALVELAVKKYKGQLTTTSRGSASSYYSCKLLGFTTMDRFDSEVPIYPERFITKERIEASHQMPDIDFNVAGQEPFISAGRELFGEHGCYPLLAVGKLGEKSGFKLYAGVKGVEPAAANGVSKCIDQYNESLKLADGEEDKRNIHIEDYIRDKEQLKLFEDSKSYQNIIEQAKVHACGFMLFNGDPTMTDVIGYGDIRYEIGLIRSVSESTSSCKMVVNLEGSLLDVYGYVKDDFLIVDVVSIIHKLYQRIGRSVPTVSELKKMVEKDTLTWNLYAAGATCCLNQCEKPATTKRIMRYKPQNIKELAAFIACIRPGFKSLIEGFLNREEYTNGEAAIDELLKDCFHYMLYQEAVMKIFTWLGIPMQDSYDTIKKISKKKLKGEALQYVENTLKNHWLQNIGNLNNFEPVYKVIKDSTRYSLNGPHALAMAYDSLYEAWIKAHYPSVFYEVVLNHYQDEKENKSKVTELLKEAKTFFGYSLGAFEYGKDNTKFTVVDSEKVIYPNLASVKGIGAKAAQAVLDIANKGCNDFIMLYLSAKDLKVNASVFRALTKINYFRRLGTVKKLLRTLDIVDEWRTSANEERKILKKNEYWDKKAGAIDLSLYATDRLESGRISGRQYKVNNWMGLVHALAAEVPDEEYPPYILARFQYEVLGYITIHDPETDWRYVIVTGLSTTYSPKFQAYSVGKGKSVEMKIHKKKAHTACGGAGGVRTSFDESPVKEGDVIYVKDVRQECKRMKTDRGWTEVPNEKEWWLKEYYIVSEG